MRQIKIGSTDISVDVYIIDSTTGLPETGVLFNTAGIDLEYRREGAAAVNITEVTLLALTTAHTDGGFLEIGHGFYRLDVPDAAFASGAESVSIQGAVTGMVVLPQTVQLNTYDGADYLTITGHATPTNITAGTITTVTTLTGHTAQTGDNFARIGANGAGLTDLTTATGFNVVVPTAAAAQIAQFSTTDGLINGLNDIAATDIVSAGAITTLTGAVVNVDLVDVTTTNTDMRGTDSANTTAPDNAGIAGIQTDLDNAADGLGAIKASVDAIPTTVMRGTDSAATAANLATVDSNVDAVKVKTDQMTYTKANELDANTKSMNDAEIIGNGNSTPWDGA